MSISARVYKARLRKVAAELKRSGTQSAMLLSSAIPYFKHDTEYFFRQDSDFYYLTGITAQRTAILLTSGAKRATLFTTRPDAHTLLWEGKQEGVEAQASALDADLVVTSDVRKEIESRLKGVAHLYHQNSCGSLSWEIARDLISLPSYRRRGLPASFSHVSTVLHDLRQFKSPEEITAIRSACDMTCRALYEALPLIQAGATEDEWPRLWNIGFAFKARGSHSEPLPPSVQMPRFSTIVPARGAEAREMILLDCGSELDLYSADITRVLPIERPFSDLQRELYDIVFRAQRAAIARVKHQVRIGVIYDAAARVITEGLVSLGVLRGSAKKHFEKNSFKPYFPHSIGHSLGLDVHDVGDLRGNNGAVLKKGMVFTIEPGLYFAKRCGAIPACGLRLEDSVVVTERGCKVLTEGFPKDIDAIETLVAAASAY